MKIASIFLIFAIMTWPISSASESAAEDPIWNAFSPVDSTVEAELQDWFEDSYLPNLDSNEFHLRSRFAGVDSSELDRRFKMSFDDVERFDRDSRGRPIHPETLDLADSDVLLEMFPGVAYRVAVTSHDTGRHNGMSMVRIWVVENGFTGRERVYFEIKRTGEILGFFRASPRTYLVNSTPTDGVVVISEIDYDAYRKANPIRID
jgi:hypothetical protein